MNKDKQLALAEIPQVVAAVATSDRVLFPNLIFPFTPGRQQTLAAVESALECRPPVFLMVLQKRGTPGEPSPQELCSVGTLVIARPVPRIAAGKAQVVVQGLTRARIAEILQVEPFLQVRIETIEEAGSEQTAQERALVRSVREDLRDLSSMNGKRLPPQVLSLAEDLSDPGRLADLVASNLELEPGEAQEVLETVAPVERLLKVAQLLSDRLEYLKVRADFEARAQSEAGRSRHVYLLRQQLRAIQEQLGEQDDESSQELERYLEMAREVPLPEKARAEVERCVRQIRWAGPSDAESANLRAYLDFLTSLPWRQAVGEPVDIRQAEEILEKHHWGLEAAKQRILEFLAVQALHPDGRGPILCFLGPPGVGKTSLCRSISLALRRPFVRIPLGGLRDEAQIRGHRRAYIGARPGVILQGIHQVGVANPVLLLDEVDKIVNDGLKNPSAALLDALDPEQNIEFHDHYLSLPYDLSRVLFLATANSASTIPPTLLDRMELIRLPGYAEEEKVRIARHSLIRRALMSCGLAERDLRITDSALRRIVRGYTQEAGLREFERQIGKIVRKVAVQRARGSRRQVSVSAQAVADYLGPARRFSWELLWQDRVGIATGLVWTPFGGDLVLIEALDVPGIGKLQLTGQLGSVMRESAQTALSVARRFAEQVGLDRRFFLERDLHIHLPAGSIPKEGASSGVTIATALISLQTGRPLRRKVAMTGEISLHGKLLPVTGIREKILAARAAGIEEVILPEFNRLDVESVQPSLRGSLRFHFVSHVQEVVEIALSPRPSGQRRSGERRA